MKKQKKSIQERLLIRAVIMPVLFFALYALVAVKAHAQTPISNQFSYSGSQKIRDITVPSGYTYVYLEAKGADGGATKKGLNDKYPGGSGALVSAYFRVGTAAGQIPPGATLRFIVGQKGGSDNYGGGGGGTGIAVKSASGSWQLLLVAGGGGGCGSTTGGSGLADTGGDGSDGDQGSGNAAAGGYGYKASLSSSGEPIGKAGKTADADNNSGGFGFGGGGSSRYNSGGGGGGYSGGNGGKSVNNNYGADGYGGEGGSSYVDTDPNLLLLKLVKTFGGTTSPQDGSAAYEFTNENPVSSIRFAANTAKCAAIKDPNTAGDTNVELAPCADTPAQQWIVDDFRIKPAANTAKCLELYKNLTANGTNVQLHTCNDSPGQKWIYDVYRKILRSGNDFNKCIDLVNGNTASGTNIQLWDCVSDVHQVNQQWVIDKFPSSMPTGANKKIHLEKDGDKCIDLDSYDYSNGTNVRLYHCRTTNVQYFVFDNRYIRSQSATNKCLSLKDSGDANGNNIHLWDCKGQDNQKWVYDGLAKAFRSVVNINKCLSIEGDAGSEAPDGANIHLWDCKNNGNQRFDLY